MVCGPNLSLSLQWLELHLHQQIPASLLLLSRALYLPEDVPTALKTTLSSLPEAIVEETEVLVADTLGEMVDNKVRLEVLRQQEELIREEAAEKDREVGLIECVVELALVMVIILSYFTEILIFIYHWIPC